MSIKIKLQSDFSDYYDHWFCSSHENPGLTFHRTAEGGLSRNAQFKLMEDVGWSTAPFSASPRFLLPEAEKPDSIPVVVYTDPYAHRGEGKQVFTLAFARHFYPTCPCSLFIDTGAIAISRRLLCIGDRTFWLEYKNIEDWRSNYGGTIINVIGEGLNRKMYFQESGPEWRGNLLDEYPLWAVDFVQPAGRDELYAIDFNSAPGLSGTGIRGIVTAKDVYSEIERVLFLHRRAIA